jgi:hypothetical protein
MNARIFVRARAIALAAVLAPLACTSNRPETYATPEDAVRALLDAADDPERADAMLGPDGYELLVGDPSDPDAPKDVARVRELADERLIVVESDDPNRMVALLGEEEWPLPLVREDGRWRFDAATAREDLRCRRIGANELLTLDALRTIADEQARRAFEHAGSGPPVYEPGLVIETEGGGLHWNAAFTATDTTVVPPTAAEPLEARDVEPRILELDQPVAGPFHGYLFRVLDGQGEHACGGARSYLDDEGRRTGGFALLAWPERYGESGVMTFVIDRTGIPYEKDLGQATERAAAEIAVFDPDGSWMLVVE